jgi:hypothetical protein
VDDRRSLRAAHDHLQPLAPAATHRDGESPARLELLVEDLRKARSCGRDGDRGERSFRQEAERAVPEVHLNAVVTRLGKVLARLLRELGDAFDRVHFVRELG